MEERQGIETMQEGFDLLAMWARNIALLPLEDWWNALEHAEAVAPILDPTLYREYLYSGKAKIIKELIEAAIPLKAVVMKAQPGIRKELGIEG